MKQLPFERAKHVYRNDAFAELIKDAIRFFNGTPVVTLPPPEQFSGRGVYAIYYTGSNPIYARYAELNRTAYDFPIYVGKAVPAGWRQSRISDSVENQSSELYRRLAEHGGNIRQTSNLKLREFFCRFVIFEHSGSDMIGTVEAALIKLKRPLWNCCLDGFGNHDPGSGRYQQARSDWDVMHPGRSWAMKCKGRHNTKQSISEKIKAYLSTL
jgi:hypothetical protein